MSTTLSYTPSFFSFTGSQVVIPLGAKSAKISFVAGTGFANGVSYVAPFTIDMGKYGDKSILSTPIVVGLSGGSCQGYWEV